MGQEISTLLFWMCIGALLHLLEDSLTVMGIPMITPVPAPEANGVPWLTRKRRFSLGITHTGGILEYLIMVVVLVVAVVVIKLCCVNENGTFLVCTDQAERVS